VDYTEPTRPRAPNRQQMSQAAVLRNGKAATARTGGRLSQALRRPRFRPARSRV